MDKLTLVHLSPYLPYGLKIETPNGTHALKGIDTVFSTIGLNYWMNGKKKISFSVDCKPILRPLSDLTKEIEHNGKKFVPIDVINEYHTIEFDGKYFYDDYSSCFDVEYLPYDVIKKLFEWHFDISNLIGRGFAIDINTL